MINRLQPKPFADEFEAIISSAEFSDMSSTQLREKTAEALERCGHPRASGFDIERDASGFSLQPSWHTHPDRWLALQLIAEDYLSVDANTSQDEEEEVEEEAEEPVDSEAETNDQEDEGGTAERAIESVVGKFSKKKEVDEFLLGKLPTIPIIGWPIKAAIFLFVVIKAAWNWFLDLLTKVADRMDLKNNIVAAIDYVARMSKLTEYMVIFLATVISYFGFFIFVIIIPLLRVITDPLGRLFKTIQRRLNRGSPSDEDDTDDESGVPT